MPETVENDETMTRRRRIRHILSRAWLLAVLLFVQVTVVSHLDLDGHSQETQCAICVSLSTLDAANVSDHQLLIDPSVAETSYLGNTVLFAARHNGQKRARAPPVAS